MEESTIEKNRLENIDLLQMEYFSDLPISNKDILIIEPSNPIAITIRKFLVKLGFENIYVCKISDCVQIFSSFINKEISIPIIMDDAISYVNIKNTISEIFEIQPNAKIIIITAKGRTDMQIIELFNLGIFSILQKPLNFQDFKKALSGIFEKDNDISEINNKNNFEFTLSSSKKISQNKIQDSFKIEIQETDNIIKKLLDKRSIILESDILEAACNQCESTNITFISECPNCKGINFKQQNLLEHYRCGEVFPKESNNNICPKCNRDIGSVGKDYREFSDYFVCNSCNDRFPKPFLRFNCLDCGNFFIEKLAAWKKGKIYKIQS